MTTIWDVYTFIRQLTDKAYLPPTQVGGWLEAAQLEVFNSLRSGGTLDNVTQSALAPFLVQDLAFTSSIGGHFNKPTGFAQVARLVNSAGLEHTPILFSELRDATISALEPLEQYPRYQEAGNYIVVYPMQLTRGTLNYYRIPVAPVIGYTLDANGLPIYNSGASVQLELPPAYWLDVIIKALPYVGVNLADSDVFALAQQKQAA